MSYRILVVDDSQSNLDLIKQGLEIFGYDVDTATDGNDALKKLEQRFLDERSPHLVLSDIEMPKVGGIELLERCRELYPNLYFIIMSGSLSGYTKKLDELRVPYLEKGVDNFIERLNDKIRSILNQQS